MALSHPHISITELQSGQWIELGEQPELYPVEQGVPELPMLLNKLLKPIRYDDLGLLGFGQWDGDPNNVSLTLTVVAGCPALTPTAIGPRQQCASLLHRPCLPPKPLRQCLFVW